MNNPAGYTALLNSFYKDTALYDYWDVYSLSSSLGSRAKYKDYIDAAVLYE